MRTLTKAQISLIIDDDRDLSEMLIEYLSPEGFAPECSHTGEGGLKRALTENFDLGATPIDLTPYQNRIKTPCEANKGLRESALSRWPNLLKSGKNVWSQ